MSNPAAFPRPLAITLLGSVATLFATNHVAARVAFDEGTGLLLAILVRSSVAVVVLGGLVLGQTLSPVQLLGGGMVLAGIVILGLSKRQ